MHIRRRPLSIRLSRGFTLVELLVSLAVMMLVILGLLALFDFSHRLSSVQNNVAEMQQSQRIAQQDMMRLVRMAGRGPVSLGTPPAGMAVAVSNDVPDDTHIGAGSGTPTVVPGSDILTIRGVFSTSVFQVNSNAPNAFAIQTEDGGPSSGLVLVASTTPTTIPQNLQALKDAVLNAREDEDKLERLLLVSARNPAVWSVVVLKEEDCDITTDPITLGFDELPAGDPVRGRDVVDLGAVAFVGILEEYRFYLREGFKVAPNGTQDIAYGLSRARVFPGTDIPWRGFGDNSDPDDTHASWRADIADNIVDLQVALAFDTTRGGGRFDDDEGNDGDDDRIYEAADGDDDDWLFNGETFNAADWLAGDQLYFIRLSTLARTDRRDPGGYTSPQVMKLEDHDLSGARINLGTDRRFRYRPLSTLIDMRNL